MFSYIKGKVVEQHPQYVIVDVQGIGYKILTTSSLKQVLEELVIFYTTHVVREDFEGLYGFLDKSERALFEMLIQLSGVGPKLAMSLLSHMKVQELSMAVLKEDVKLLSSIPGVGKKTAERLIVEMRGKFPQDSTQMTYSQAATNVDHEHIVDAVAALEHLGFSAMHAERAVLKTIESGKKMVLAEIIRESLKLVNSDSKK